MAKKYWTKEKCITEAKKYQYRNDFKKTNYGCYSAALKHKWLDQCCVHMKQDFIKWDKEKILKEANKYNSKTEWRNRSPKSYDAAIRHRILKECSAHMNFIRTFWTNEEILNDAYKYKTSKAWSANSPNIYQAAFRRKIIKKCTEHMDKYGGTSQHEKDLIIELSRKINKSMECNKIFCVSKYFINKPHIHRFELDIYIPELRKGVEFNGKYYHSVKGLKRGHPKWPLSDIFKYHALKKEFFKSIDIDYIEIEERDWIENSQKCVNKCLKFLK